MGARGGAGAARSGVVEGRRFWWRDDDAAGRALATAMLTVVRHPERALKRGRRKSLFALEHAGRAYLVKVNDYPRGWRAWVRRSKARREWERADAALARGIDTPRPAAIGEERGRTGDLRRCLLAVARVDGARDLAACWAETPPPWPERVRLARGLGELAAAMHAAGLHQRDFAPNNVLVVPGASGERLLPIDFERVELGGPVSPRDAAIALAKLYRYRFDASRGLWWRLLLAYCGGDRAAARAMARRVAAELPAMFRRDLSHMRRTAGRDNRRFRVLPAGGGWAHRAIDDAALRDALGGADDGAWWRTAVAAASARDALATWAAAQTLAQRSGLIARPVAMVSAAFGRRDGWTLVATRRPGDRVWRDDEENDAARRVLTRRLAALGLPAPDSAELLGCRDGAGARLLTPPGTGLV